MKNKNKNGTCYISVALSLTRFFVVIKLSWFTFTTFYFLSLIFLLGPDASDMFWPIIPRTQSNDMQLPIRQALQSQKFCCPEMILIDFN